MRSNRPPVALAWGLAITGTTASAVWANDFDARVAFLDCDWSLSDVRRGTLIEARRS